MQEILAVMSKLVQPVFRPLEDVEQVIVSLVVFFKLLMK
jgi:hypothetical protein